MEENNEVQPEITGITFDDGVITVTANFTMSFPGDNDIQIPCLIRFIADGFEPVEFDHGLHRVSPELLAVLSEAIDYCSEELEEWKSRPAPEPEPEPEPEEFGDE